jgi:hypothetical protein
MKRLKQTFIILGVLILFIFLFRSWIFKTIISYTPIQERKYIELENEKLFQEIEMEMEGAQLTIDKIIHIARRKTNEKLFFTTEKSSRNPNEVLKVGKANCIGYSALFNSISNHLIKNQKLETKYKAKHLVGQIDFMGIDLHQFFDDPSLKDHDYNEITNIETGEKIYIDPTVSDYLGIHEVSSNVN